MSALPVWKRDGFFIHIQARDYATGEFYWRRANEGDFSVILGAAVDAEREACAKIAEANPASLMLTDFAAQDIANQVKTDIAEAIRKREG